MKKLCFALVALGLGALAPIQQASAHVGWANRDLITNAAASVDNGDGSTTFQYRFGQATGNYGWADGADSDWGDSHRVRFTKFEITNAGGALVDINVFAASEITNPTTGAVSTVLGDLNPGFTLYKGTGPLHSGANPWMIHNLVPQSSFDWPTSGGANLAPHADDLGKEGLFNALGDVTMSTNAGVVGTQEYLTHMGTLNSRVLVAPNNSSVSLTNYLLGPGWYSVVIGGTDTFAQAYHQNDDPNVNWAALNGVRGFHVDLTVQPVPVPAAVWFMGSALIGLIGIRKRNAAVV
jgi:hypothetical protein